MVINLFIYHTAGEQGNKDRSTLLEFPVTHNTECSRVASRGYVFTLDTESLLLTFANETGEIKERKRYVKNIFF